MKNNHHYRLLPHQKVFCIMHIGPMLFIITKSAKIDVTNQTAMYIFTIFLHPLLLFLSLYIQLVPFVVAILAVTINQSWEAIVLHTIKATGKIVIFQSTCGYHGSPIIGQIFFDTFSSGRI